MGGEEAADVIYLDFIKVLDMVPRDIPVREVGKKAQAAPGVEMSSLN